MKTFHGTAAVLVLVASATFAKDDLGPFADARSAWPDAFVPGKVAAVDLAGEALYAFAGEAESFFDGEFAESDAELYEEAMLDAKARFYETMSGGDASRSVSLSGLRVAYRWAEGPMRRVVCVVPRRNVKVAPPPGDPTRPATASDLPAPVQPAPEVPAPAPGPPGPDSAGTAPPPASAAEAPDASDTGSDARPPSDELPIEARIRACRDRLAENPGDPFARLRLARLFAQSGQAARATRHYRDLVKRLASDRNAMPVRDAAAAMVEAAEHARATGDEAQALKFYRSAWKLDDPDLQPRITAAISLLRLRGD